MKISGKLFIAIFLGSIILVSCDVNDDGFFQSTQVSRILSADVPDTMVVGETYTLGIAYEKDSNCHTFSNFQTVNQGDSLFFVRAITTFTQNGNCNLDPEEALREADFTNDFESNFTFKFLKDRDSLGDFIYLNKEVIVIEE
ncbi:hypothetical protein ACFQ0R_04135 [Psychroflexus salinarum]|uniref:Lipoprotein n=1 Tax=Psychroflexus salinarum TaxID=546024 RepID=A0ABW3GMX1_9FLAO